MKDPRYTQLAQLLVKHSTKIQPGERVLVEATCIPSEMLVALTEAICQAGGIPVIDRKDPLVARKLLLEGTLEECEARIKYMGELELHRMKEMQAYISLRGAENLSEQNDVPSERTQIFSKFWQKPVHIEQRVKHTKWVVLRWPTASMAQQAKMSTEAFEDYFFSVCLANYAAMEKAVQPLVTRMKNADAVHIIAPDTDLKFSIKGIGAKPCFGLRNIPDGECYSAPVKNSVNGYIHYNAPTIFQGIAMDDIRLVFKDGRVVEATSSDSAELNRILDTDVDARCIGEFALGFNPNVTTPMRDILFDEKIRGSLHIALGQCYDDCYNGSQSAIHWDMVQLQEGGGEIWFDGELLRKDGRFIPEDLQGLNPENMQKL